MDRVAREPQAGSLALPQPLSLLPYPTCSNEETLLDGNSATTSSSPSRPFPPRRSLLPFRTPHSKIRTSAVLWRRASAEAAALTLPPARRALAKKKKESPRAKPGSTRHEAPSSATCVEAAEAEGTSSSSPFSLFEDPPCGTEYVPLPPRLARYKSIDNHETLVDFDTSLDFCRAATSNRDRLRWSPSGPGTGPSRFSHRRRMFPLTSPLVEIAKVTAVFVKSTEDWNKVGAAAWAEMMAGLAEQPPTRRVMGIDSEWFRKNPLATVQVATATHCFVLHLSYLDNRALPSAVKEAFEDDKVIKCGVGVSGDVKRLQSEQNLEMRSIMELGNYATLVELAEFGKTNLGALLRSVCGLEMEKDKMITRSNWELPLSQQQFSYAADDAVASFLVGDRIMQEAVTKFSLPNETFNAAVWLSQNGARAAAALKAILREKQREATERLRQEAAGTATADNPNGLPVVPQSMMRVRVLNKDGAFLFDCSLGRAKFYVEEKSIATVTQWRPEHPHKPLEIRLNFENQTNTRLCMYHAVGQCELGEHCPFAHGVGQLCEAAQELLRDPATHTCAFCLTPKNLLRHAIVPPSFRKFLPKPMRYPSDTEDFVPICGSCNTLVRHYYDYFMKQVYQEAEKADELGKVYMDRVGKCVSYARLLLDERKLAKVPAERQEQLREYILANWTATRMYDKDEDREVRARATANAAAPGSEEKEDVGAGDAQAQKSLSPAAAPQGAGAEFEDDWESLEGDDAAAACADRTATECPHKFFVDKNGTKVSVRDPSTAGGDINRDFLERLSHLVPGEVRARITMQTLVGRDAEKAKEFVERWRRFCLDSCGMVEKPSNHLTAAQWEELTKNSSMKSSRQQQKQDA